MACETAAGAAADACLSVWTGSAFSEGHAALQSQGPGSPEPGIPAPRTAVLGYIDVYCCTQRLEGFHALRATRHCDKPA